MRHHFASRQTRPNNLIPCNDEKSLRHSDFFLRSGIRKITKLFTENRFFASLRMTVAMHNNVGFTLAEVLITLGIIGIIAAITIPSLITKYKKQIAATHLRKTYSAISQAVRLSEVENGSAKNWDYPDINYNGEQLNIFYDYYLKNYIKIVRKEVRGNGIILFLADGTEIDLFNLNQRFEFYVIIPNIQKKIVNGKNMFFIAINKPTGQIILDGQGLDRKTLLNNKNYGCNKNASRGFCTALIQIDGWEIKSDYPWDEL